jgi:hypothetical protein
MTSETVSYFGTTQEPGVRQTLNCGPLSLILEAGMPRTISWHGVELVRAITYPVRDEIRGTLSFRTITDRRHKRRRNRNLFA